MCSGCNVIVETVTSALALNVSRYWQKNTSKRGLRTEYLCWFHFSAFPSFPGHSWIQKQTAQPRALGLESDVYSEKAPWGCKDEMLHVRKEKRGEEGAAELSQAWQQRLYLLTFVFWEPVRAAERIVRLTKRIGLCGLLSLYGAEQSKANCSNSFGACIPYCQGDSWFGVEFVHSKALVFPFLNIHTPSDSALHTGFKLSCGHPYFNKGGGIERCYTNNSLKSTDSWFCLSPSLEV